MSHKERPILMQARSVQAIIEGRKTQTRRIIKPQPVDVGFGRNCEVAPYCTGTDWPLAYYEMRGACWNSSSPLKCPYGQPGDRLWVRETWQEFYASSRGSRYEAGIRYLADGAERIVQAPMERFAGDHRRDGNGLRWRSSIHMPRWASRLDLLNREIRVERVQQISEEDCRAEGVQREDLPSDPDNFHPPGSYGFVPGIHPFPKGRIYPRPQEAFAELWDDTNGKGIWQKNDWVWVIAFRRTEPETDRKEQAEWQMKATGK